MAASAQERSGQTKFKERSAFYESEAQRAGRMPRGQPGFRRVTHK